jgi:WD40 repeat protein
MSQPMFAIAGTTSSSNTPFTFAAFEQYSGKQASDLQALVYSNRRRIATPFFTDNLSPQSLSFSPNGQRVVLGASNSTTGRYTVLNIEDDGTVTQVPNENSRTVGSGINEVRYSPDGSLIAFACNGASGTGNKRLVVLNATTLVEVFSSTRSTDGLMSVVFSPDGTKLLAVGYGTNPITLYNTSDWTFIAPPVPPATGDSISAAISANGQQCVIGTDSSSDDLVATVYNTSDLTVVQNIDVVQDGYIWPNSFDFSPDGTRLAMCLADGGAVAVRVFETTTWTVVDEIPREYDDGVSPYDAYYFTRIKYTQNGTRLICLGTQWNPDGTVCWIVDPTSATIQAAGNVPVFFNPPVNLRESSNGFLIPKDLVLLPSPLVSKRLNGTVEDHTGAPAQRLVRVYNRSTGALMDEQMSGVDGSFSFAFMHDPELQRVVVASAGDPIRNDLTDRIIPL